MSRIKHSRSIIIAFLGVCVIVCTIISCHDSPASASLTVYRKIAWDSLTEQEKGSIIVNMEKAKVKLNDVYVKYKTDGSDPDKIPAVSIRFNTKDDALLGPIVVYIDPETNDVLGQALRY